MIASLTLSSFLSYCFVNLHVFSDSNRFITVRLFNEDTRMVHSFNWYVWRGENNKVINEDGTFENKWALLDVVDTNGSVIYSSPIQPD